MRHIKLSVCEGVASEQYFNFVSEYHQIQFFAQRLLIRSFSNRHNRFLMRLMHRNPENVALGILNGHNCLVSGTYKYSLGEYMSVFKQEPRNPMVALMLGLTFTHMACQKFSAKKHSLVVQVGRESMGK